MSYYIANASKFSLVFTVSSYFSDHQRFVLLCLRLLKVHLQLANTGSLSSQIFGKESQPIRNLLFLLIDEDSPKEIEEVNLYYCFIWTNELAYSHDLHLV